MDRGRRVRKEWPGRLGKTGEWGKSQGGEESFRKDVSGQMLAGGHCEVRTETCPLDWAACRWLDIRSLCGARWWKPHWRWGGEGDSE